VRKTDPKLSVYRVRNWKPPEGQRQPFACRPNEIETLLDQALSPLLNERRLDECRQQAVRRYPVTVYDGQDHGRRFGIVMEGNDLCAYDPPAGVPGKGTQNKHGTPACSLQSYLKEFMKQKEKQNALAKHRPNLLAVNGRGLDWQLALDDGVRTEDVLSALPLPSSIDGILLTSCDTASKLAERAPRILPPNHPLLSWF
jgi:hypothetical protein